jgi:hypothetical protein
MSLDPGQLFKAVVGSPPDPSASWLERRRAEHRVGGEEAAINRAHIDVPALALRGFHPGQIAHRGEAGLHVGRDRVYDEGALERIDSVLFSSRRPILQSSPSSLRIRFPRHQLCSWDP